MPDLENKSSNAVECGCAGPFEKGHMAHNYHSCLSVILQLLKSNQCMIEPIHGFVRIGNHIARHCSFLAFVIGDVLSGEQLCGRCKNYSPHVADYLVHTMYQIQMIQIGNVIV